MQSSLMPGYGLWFELVVVLALGTAVIAGLAAIAGRLVRTAVWQRTIWQAAMVGLLALVLAELTGTASAVVGLARAKTKRPLAATSPAPRAIQGQHSDAAGTPESTLRPEEASGRARGITAIEQYRPVDQEEEEHVFAAAARNDRAQFWSAAVSAAPYGQDTRASSRPTIVHGDFVEPDPAIGPSPVREHAVGERVSPASAQVSHQTSATGAEAVTVAVSDADHAPAAAVRQPESQDRWWPGMVWMLGAMVVAGRFLWARLLLCRFRRQQPVAGDQALCRRVAALARRLGIQRPITVLEAAGLTAPVAFGSWRPTLALPIAFSREFEPRQQEAMIVHELAHLAGRDPAWQFAADVVCVLLWWHPLCWWSRRRLRAASEAAADEASLLIPEGPDLLASCLIALGRRLAGVRPRLGWLSVGGSGFRSSLGRRVERLLHLSHRPGRAPRRGPLALARTILPVALVVIAVLCTAWAHPQVPLAEGGTTMNVLRVSWHRSLAAAALAAFLGPFSGDAVSQEHAQEPIPVLFADEEPSAEREGREARERERGDRGEPEREFLVHQIEVLRAALPPLREAERRDAVELVELAIRAREVTLEGRRDDEAHMIRQRAPNPRELAEVLAMAADLWREFDNPDKAEVVAELAEQLRARDDRRPERPRDRERGEQEERELVQRRRELAERAGHIERELVELGDREEAQELRRELEAIREEIHQIEKHLRGPAPQQERIRQRLEELERAFHEAREAGREEEAERIRHEAEEIERELRRRAERPEWNVPHPEEREAMDRRMHHIRAAVENLHAAGLHEHAEHLERQMEHLLHGPPRHPGPPEPREMPPVPEELERVIHELADRVRELDERMEQIGQEVDQAMEELRQEAEGALEEIHQEMEAFGEEVESEIAEMQERLEALSERESDD